ncbi:alpha/beta fold hydrolase [Geitlerinema sp. P-1104]|uniref:alpha/beta fold hydrolase n=1 Tax=Geitlerinema sp. P-1104 TaxID=2546230 RepID=UPI002570B345|nr:alpha/beta fold hydrolase [Geitlerinema sp. P-1104]
MASVSLSAPDESKSPTIVPKFWNWRGFRICYRHQGQSGPAMVLVHGFGASMGHWRKNIPDWAQFGQVYALDLLGFGNSHKPTPGLVIDYTFETWGDLVADFCREVVGEPAFLIGNSIGCIVVMQTAVSHPDWVRGVVQLNCSLRLLHDKRRASQPWIKQLSAPILQNLLAIKPLGDFFFAQLATPKTVRKILLQAYRRQEAVSEELVELLLLPARDRRASDVFIAFTRYSQGPLPEELLESLPCPTLILWGEDDPWEPVELGRKLADYPAVDAFITLPNVGHCPQDEAPEEVNAQVRTWLQQQV